MSTLPAAQVTFAFRYRFVAQHLLVQNRQGREPVFDRIRGGDLYQIFYLYCSSVVTGVRRNVRRIPRKTQGQRIIIAQLLQRISTTHLALTMP